MEIAAKSKKNRSLPTLVPTHLSTSPGKFCSSTEAAARRLDFLTLVHIGANGHSYIRTTCLKACDVNTKYEEGA